MVSVTLPAWPEVGLTLSQSTARDSSAEAVHDDEAVNTTVPVPPLSSSTGAGMLPPSNTIVFFSGFFWVVSGSLSLQPVIVKSETTADKATASHPRPRFLNPHPLSLDPLQHGGG